MAHKLACLLSLCLAACGAACAAGGPPADRAPQRDVSEIAGTVVVFLPYEAMDRLCRARGAVVEPGYRLRGCTFVEGLADQQVDIALIDAALTGHERACVVEHELYHVHLRRTTGDGDAQHLGPGWHGLTWESGCR